MIIKKLNTLLVFCLINLVACSQDQEISNKEAEKEETVKHTEIIPSKSHNFGGWYCPDNLNGFPAVNIANWEDVPVITGRMPTLEEAKSEASLIYVDPDEYPEARSIDMKLPALALYRNWSTQRVEIVIAIQAFSVGRDSIVGFRYLNGGNGSAPLVALDFDFTADDLVPEESQFVTQSVFINAKPVEIWTVLTDKKHAEKLKETLKNSSQIPSDWRENTNVNYYYEGAGNKTSEFGDILYGTYYIQNDYDSLKYTEKFMLLYNETTRLTELRMVCGPFTTNYSEQKNTLINWGKQVKVLSENK